MTALGDIESNVVVPTADEVTSAIEAASGGGGGERVLAFNRTSTPLTISSETVGAEDVFITADPVTLDGSTPIYIEFSVPYAEVYSPGGDQTGGQVGSIYAYNGSTTTLLRYCVYRTQWVDGGQRHRASEPVYRKVFVAASSLPAATYTFSIRFRKSGANGGTHATAYVGAGAGTTDAWDQGYIRVTVANLEV